MRIYGNKAGRVHRVKQPEPALRCPTCKMRLPESAFVDMDGRHAECDRCRAKARKRHDETSRMAKCAKRCAKCGVEKPAKEFVGRNGAPTKTCSACRNQRKATRRKESR